MIGAVTPRQPATLAPRLAQLPVPPWLRTRWRRWRLCGQWLPPMLLLAATPLPAAAAAGAAAAESARAAPAKVADACTTAPRVELAVQLDPATRQLRGEATWTLPAGRPLAVELDRRLRVEAVSADGRATTAVALPAADGTRQRLQFTPPSAGNRSAPVRWQLRWSGELAALDRTLDHRAVIGPLPAMASLTGSYLPAGAGWYPEADGALCWRLRVTMPAGQRAIVPARLLSEREEAGQQVSEFEALQPQEGITLMAGPYRVDEQMLKLDTRAIRLRTYFPEALARLAPEYLASTARFIERFDRQIGPYPFDGFSIVASPLPTGFGLPGATYVSEAILPLPFMRGQSLAHEILHNWWGNGVRVDWARGNWSEGLTTLLADHALRLEQSPEAARLMRWGWLRDFAALPSGADAPLAAFTARTHGAASAVGYGKSAMLFHMVRGEIGEDAFNLALRDLWTTRRGGVAAWADLQRLFEQRGGRPLAALFAPMLEQRGGLLRPPAAIRHDPARRSVELTWAEPLPFSISLPAMLSAGEREVPVRIALRRGERSARIDLSTLSGGRVEAPDTLQLDPGFDTWRALAPGESPALLRDAMLAPDAGFVLLGQNDETWRDAARTLASRMLENRAAREVPPAELNGTRALLVIGSHDEIEQLTRRTPALARPATLGRLPDAAAWATRAGNAAARVLISVEDTAALIDLQRRAPHYGAQSFIAFRNGKLTVQGIGAMESPKLPISR
jgi:aminopeptidase N